MPIHSFTSIKLYRQCPQQYNQVRVLRAYPYQPGPEAAFGDRAHAALEKAGRDGAPLPPEFSPYQWVIDRLIPTLLPVRVFEQEFSFTQRWTHCGARDWAVKHWSGKADVLAFDTNGAPTRAQCIDWKTGKDGFPDVEQLELMALFTMVDYPTVDIVKGALVFLQTAKVEHATFTRAQLGALQAKWEAYVRQIDNSIATGNWPTQKSPLCPYCPHKTCPNWSAPKPKRQ